MSERERERKRKVRICSFEVLKLKRERERDESGQAKVELCYDATTNVRCVGSSTVTCQQMNRLHRARVARCQRGRERERVSVR